MRRSTNNGYGISKDFEILPPTLRTHYIVIAISSRMLAKNIAAIKGIAAIKSIAATKQIALGCSALLWAALGCPGMSWAALGCSGLL